MLAISKNKTGGATRIFGITIAIFFVLMLAIPTSFTLMRLPLLAVILLMAMLGYIFYSKVYISNEIFIVFFANLMASLVFSFNGATLNAPGALAVMTVYFLWPIIFMFLIGITPHLDRYKYTLRCLPIGGILASSLGSRLIDIQSQNMTVAASATAERKTFGHLS